MGENPQLIDAYASWPHLVEHLAPIWCALPPETRGRFSVATRQLREQAANLGVDAVFANEHHNPGGPVLVANAHDLRECRAGRPVIYVEHGAGQTYVGFEEHPSYSGGGGRDTVALFLTLNETTAARERARYPDAQVEIVGSPRLDALASRVAATGASQCARPVVAFSWHWNSGMIPETRETFTHWRYAVRGLMGWEVLGHGHPRFIHQLARFYTKAGIEVVPDFAETVSRADVFAADNTSALYEAAALGIPVLVLNAPWYRRDVHHGLRFWDLIPGVQCDHPADLWRMLDQAKESKPDPEIIDRVYPPHTRGRAAELAAEAILARFGSVT